MVLPHIKKHMVTIVNHCASIQKELNISPSCDILRKMLNSKPARCHGHFGVKSHPEGGGGTGSQAEDYYTVKHNTHVRQRISTGLQTPGCQIGRQTRETQVEQLKQ